jgi:hypothetical protein
LRQAILNRDREMMISAGISQRITCAAPVIDPSQQGMCFGRSTLDHVKDQPRMGLRAPSDEAHLATLCEGHTEAGARAGHQWNTAHRPELRQYLAFATLGEAVDD